MFLKNIAGIEGYEAVSELCAKYRCAEVSGTFPFTEAELDTFSNFAVACNQWIKEASTQPLTDIAYFLAQSIIGGNTTSAMDDGMVKSIIEMCGIVAKQQTQSPINPEIELLYHVGPQIQENGAFRASAEHIIKVMFMTVLQSMMAPAEARNISMELLALYAAAAHDVGYLGENTLVASNMEKNENETQNTVRSYYENILNLPKQTIDRAVQALSGESPGENISAIIAQDVLDNHIAPVTQDFQCSPSLGLKMLNAGIIPPEIGPLAAEVLAGTILATDIKQKDINTDFRTAKEWYPVLGLFHADLVALGALETALNTIALGKKGELLLVAPAVQTFLDNRQSKNTGIRLAAETQFLQSVNDFIGYVARPDIGPALIQGLNQAARRELGELGELGTTAFYARLNQHQHQHQH
ncbi:MAG: hypothetical protein ACK5O1_07705 [Holosporales bacterium]